jgi:uncharacterized protein DUF6580
MKPRLLVLICMILAAAASRLIPHPPNMASITAFALFGGAYLERKWLAFLVPLAGLFLSDLVLGLYSHMEVIYASFAVVVCVGLLLRGRKSPLKIAGAALASSILFFITTNLGVWFFSSLYPKTATGLFACYVAAIPFFQNTLMGDALYTAVLFGGFALAEKRFPALRESYATQLA